MGPCAKLEVFCKLYLSNGRSVTGTNNCRNPQEVCPRQPGEGYEKCKTICDQVGHAEQVAADAAEHLGYSLVGAEAVVFGHSYACRECQERLFGAGVTGLRCIANWKST